MGRATAALPCRHRLGAAGVDRSGLAAAPVRAHAPASGAGVRLGESCLSCLSSHRKRWVAAAREQDLAGAQTTRWLPFLWANGGASMNARAHMQGSHAGLTCAQCSLSLPATGKPPHQHADFRPYAADTFWHGSALPQQGRMGGWGQGLHAALHRRQCHLPVTCIRVCFRGKQVPSTACPAQQPAHAAPAPSLTACFPIRPLACSS